MKKGSKPNLASKTGAVALVLSFVAGSAGDALASCAAPQEMAALRVAALRQHLMVAALSCHQAAYFNRFVTAYQSEFQGSDHDLMQFFVRQGSGENGYNAYKTREANDSSLRSLSDPEFCGGAASAFYVALHNGLPLAELAREEAPLLHVGYAGCLRSADASDSSFASPALPARHQSVMEAAAVAPAAPPAAMPAAAAAPPVAAPAASPAPERVAALPPAPIAASAPPQQDDGAVASDAPPDQANYNAYPSQPMNGYRTAYSPPYPYNPYYSNAWYPYDPPQMRQVMGPDGRWYLVPSYVR